MRIKMRKVIAIICTVAILLSSFSTSVFAQETSSQNELREAIEGGEEMKALFPNGVFTFIGSKFNVNEDTRSFEIKIARQGGTQGEVTVDFKAIDISSKYGSDYVIEVPGFLWNKEIPSNPDSKPLIEDAAQEETEILNSDDLGLTAEEPTSEQKEELENALEGNVVGEDKPVEVPQQESQPEQTVEEPQQQESQPEQTVEEPQQQQMSQPEQTVEEPEQQESQPEQTVEEPQQQQMSQPAQTVEEPEQQESQPEQTVEEPQQQEGQPEQTVEEPQQQKSNKSQVESEAAQKLESRVSGLRSASKILSGKTYKDPDWKDLDMKPSEAEALKDSYQEYLNNTPGMQTTLTFKDGEYEKSIFIKPINDNLSESEEQFIIVLSNATGGAEIGEFYTGMVNIIDDEAFEASAFEMEMDKLEVEAGLPEVSVKVRRTKGIDTMSYVTVGTAGNSAEPNVDYIPITKKLLFLPGVTEQTFTVDLITTYTDEDKVFAIIIDDNRATSGKEKTIVTLAKASGSYSLYESMALTKSANMRTLSQSVNLMLDYSVNNQSSALEKITPKGTMKSEGLYTVMPDDFTLRYGNNAPKPTNAGTSGITINPYYAKSSAGVQAPISLSGIKKLEFSWSNTGSGKSWYHHNDWWLFGWHCRKECGWRNSKEFDSKFIINGPAAAPWKQWENNQYKVKSIHGGFSQSNVSMDVKPWMWSSSNIEYWAWNGNDNTDNKLNANAVTLTLLAYKLKIDNDPADTGVMARTVTGIDASGQPVGTGTPINVGTMRIRNVSRDGGHGSSISNSTEKFVYRSDVITFEPVFNTDNSTKKSYADDVYLWGYKVRDRQGNWKYFEGSVMNLNSQWFRENAAVYQNETQGLYANALLRDDSKGNWSIEVRPVFKAKNETFIKLDIDSSKGNIDGFLNGTSSRVFAISRFDTLKLKVQTKNSATVHNWYVINDNSNIKVSSLGDATTYFNNTKVGSSGNLPTTSSFMENSNKVELDSKNINPAVKSELTYKPTARFTNIMPSFAVNAITVQENPTSRTKYEAYDVKILSGGKDILPDFLNDNISQDFYKKEQASKKTYTFQYKIRSTSNQTVPETVKLNLYKDTMEVKAQLVETMSLTRDKSGVYSFNLNYWVDKYYGCYATMTINGVEQPVDFMLQSGAFVTLNDERNNAIKSGNAFNPIVYDKVTRNDIYTINGYTQSNFNIEWMNATGDLDKDGIISPTEDALFKEYRTIDRTKTVGDSYYLKASYDMPTVYYNFVKTDPNRNKRVISGNISVSDKTFLNQSATTTTPLEGIVITLAGEQAITDSKGNFKLESNKFEAGKSYSCVYAYQGYKYAGTMMVGQNNIIIDLFKDPDIELTNMKLYELAQNGGDELKPVNGFINLYDELDRNYDFEFDLSAGRLAGVAIKEAVIVTRDKDGGLKNESYKVAKVTGTPGKFVTKINPNSIPTNMDIGDRIFIRPIDDQGTAYPEIATGIRLVQNPENIKIQLGIDSSGNEQTRIPSVPLFGQMLAKLDFLDTNAGNAKPITDQDRANIKTLTDGSGSKLMKSAGSDDWKINETEKNLFTISLGFDNDMKDGWADAVNKSKTKVNKDAPDLSFSVGVVLVYEAADDGKVYFNQLAISGEVGMSMGVTFTYITPIGIPVYASFSFSVGVELSGALVPKDEDNPPLLDARTSWKGMVTGEVGISITIGVGVELGVGVSLLKAYLTGTAEVTVDSTFVDLGIGISVSFSAAFGVRFLFFSKEWTIISKTWGAHTVKKAMMARQSGLYQPLDGFDQISRDYLDNRSEWVGDESPRLFRALMAGNGSSESIKERIARESGAYPYPSNKLVNLPNGEILWVFLDDVPERDPDNTNPANRTAVYYSIIDADGKASLPELIDDDGTLDEAPDVLDLGNGEIMISWSDASREFTKDDKEIDVLTHMDISVAFFNVAKKTMSAPTEVTHTSGRTVVSTSGGAITVGEIGGGAEVTSGPSIIVGDYCGDTSPRAAYDSTTGRILLYYIKSDYYDGVQNAKVVEDSIDDSGTKVSDEDAQLVVGDIINAFSLITYRFAEKKSGVWVWNDASSFSDDEKDAIADSISKQILNNTLPAGYTIDDYFNDWYGQRFLDVSQYAEITETKTITGGGTTTDLDGNTYTEPENVSVRQEATLLAAEDVIDPRVVDTAVISYNGLALFAYTTDEDWDLSTDYDQELYLQIYNFSENSFSHPIRLTTDKVKINGKVSEENCVKDSQPKFVRTNGITYLFWNRNGSIAYMDISGLVKYGLKKQDLRSDLSVYVIDKNNENYANVEHLTGEGEMQGKEVSTGKWGDIVLAVDKNINPNPTEGNEATEDNAISSYDVVASDDGDVYLVWTEYKTVLKNKDDVSAAADPENQEREKQIFISRWQPEIMIERAQLDYLDENGDTEFTANGKTYQFDYSTYGIGYYPDKIIENGVAKVIDYLNTEDVNGFKGAAKAGDPIIKQNYVPTGKAGWSKPIQITTQQGANYDELGVAALEGNEGLKVAFIKYMQTLENAGGNRKVFKHDTAWRALGSLTFKPASGVEFTDSSISFGREKPQVGEQVAVSALVKNTGIDVIHGARVEFYQIVGGIETLVDTKFYGTYYENSESASEVSKPALLGGDEFNAQILYEIPENDGNISIKAVLKYEGLEDGIEAQKSFTFEAIPEISDLRYEFIDIGKIVLDGTITNAGNKDGALNVEISVVDSYGIESIIDYVPVTLNQGESSYFSKEVEIPNSYSREVLPEDGQPVQELKEMAQLKVGVGSIKDELAVVRSAPTRAVEVMNEVTDFSINEKMSIRKGTTGKIEPNITYKEAVAGQKAALRDEMVVEYTSSNPNVVQVAADGTLYAISDGTATVQAVLMPTTTISVATKGSLAGGTVAPLAQQLTSPATLPSSVLKIENVAVTVYTGTPPVDPVKPSEPSTSTGGSSSSGSVVTETTTGTKQGVSVSNENNKIYISVDANATVNDGVAAVVMDEKMANQLISEVTKNATVESQTIVINVGNIGNSDSTQLQLSSSTLNKLATIGNVQLQITSGLATTTLDGAALKEIAANKEIGDSISVVIEKNDANDIDLSKANEPEKVKAMLENRPGYSLEITSDGKSVTDFGSGHASVTVPYTLLNNEDPNCIVVYGISGTGELEVLRGYYDAETNAVNITLAEGGTFFIGYNEVNFNDIKDGAWYSDAVKFIAARGITSGIGDGNFGINQKVTRGQFITMLSKAYGIKPMTGDNFSDVKPGSYYEGYASAAKQLGISSGVGNNKFNPDKEISREEMIALLYSYLKSTDQLPKGTGKEISDFDDKQDVAPWANEAVNYFTSNGIITGTDDKILPKGKSKRVEFVQILYNLLT